MKSISKIVCVVLGVLFVYYFYDTTRIVLNFILPPNSYPLFPDTISVAELIFTITQGLAGIFFLSYAFWSDWWLQKIGLFRSIFVSLLTILIVTNGWSIMENNIFSPVQARLTAAALQSVLAIVAGIIIFKIIKKSAASSTSEKPI